MAKQTTTDETKSQEKPKVKRRFVVEVQGIAPVVLQLETWAYDEEEALKQLDNPRLMSIRQKPEIDLTRLRRHKVTIKDAITSLIKIVKNF
jgi:hypothetical protein